MAAEQRGRKCYAMEIDPSYADVIVKRWQQLTGKRAILQGSDACFEEVDRARKGG